MSRDSFVHLHLHTEYSLLDGSIRMKELMKKAAEFKMPAVAITDHGNLFGAIEFYQEAQRTGVKPIIGCETYVAPGSHKDRPGSACSRRGSSFALKAWMIQTVGACHPTSRSSPGGENRNQRPRRPPLGAHR